MGGGERGVRGITNYLVLVRGRSKMNHFLTLCSDASIGIGGKLLTELGHSYLVLTENWRETCSQYLDSATTSTRPLGLTRPLGHCTVGVSTTSTLILGGGLLCWYVKHGQAPSACTFQAPWKLQGAIRRDWLTTSDRFHMRAYFVGSPACPIPRTDTTRNVKHGRFYVS